MTRLFVVAGHGQGDPGAVANGYSEADLVRKLAHAIKDIGGDQVILGDTSIDWYKQNAFSWADIPSDCQIVELHLDSAGPDARGAHVIIKKGFSPDVWDVALADNTSNMFPGRSETIVGRDDLQNVNVTANRGLPYRLLENAFITNVHDVWQIANCTDDVAYNILKSFDIWVDSPIPPEPTVWDGPGIELAGHNLYDTAIAVAEYYRQDADTTITARSSSFADCASIAWAAGALGAKMLFEEDAPTIIDEATREAASASGSDRFVTNLVFKHLIDNYGVTPTYEHCFVVGPNSFPDAVTVGGWSYSHSEPILFFDDSASSFWDQLKLYKTVTVLGDSVPALPNETERFAGANRHETNALFAEKYYTNWDTVVFVRDNNFVDGMVAAQRTKDIPLLQVGGQATMDILAKHKSQIKNLVWIGDFYAISRNVRIEICNLLGLM